MMKKFFLILIISLFYLPIISALDLRTETNNMIDRFDSEITELEAALNSLDSYLNIKASQISNKLDVQTINNVINYLKSDNYESAFELLEEKIDDPNFNNLNISLEIDNYFTLKRDLIKFVNDNKEKLSIDSDDLDGIECSFDLLDQMKTSFSLVRPTISQTISTFNKIFAKTVENDLNNANQSSTIIQDYKNLSLKLTDLIKKYILSLEDYKQVFVVIDGSEDLFNLVVKNKFVEELNKAFDSFDKSLKEPINNYIEKKWDTLEDYVTEVVESDKTAVEKNEKIYIKIEQVNDVNDKFVTAINEIIGNLDIVSIREKINLILERGNTEFTNAINYLENHLILGGYDITLVQNHDDNISIDSASKLVILNKLFNIEEFRNQIKLINGIGTIELVLGNYNNVPNKTDINIIDANEIKNSYKVIVKGDVNGNANITITDAIEAAYYSLNAKTLDEYEIIAADLNNSNTITITDVYLIAKMALEQGGNI